MTSAKRLSFPVLLALIASAIQAAPAQPNTLPNMSLSELARKSDLVIVGTVSRIDVPIDRPNAYFLCATVRVRARMQGQSGEEVQVITRGLEAESDTGPLALGGEYVFYLTRSPDGLYDATGGPRSAYRISP